ncbi:MAG: poly-gamma-glutamate biosynthesis protein PgsC [Myxococcota bacterium]
MTELAGPEELLVLSIALGIVVSFFFSEVFGLAAGGVVVPGYVALFLDRPVAVAMTLTVALTTYGLVSVLSQFVIVYGRRRTSLMILVAFALGTALARFPDLPDALRHGDGVVIGFIIPGLIAIWFDRQGVISTVASLSIGAVFVRLLLLLFVGPLAGGLE